MYTYSYDENPEIIKLIELSKETTEPRMKIRYDVNIQLLRGYTREEIALIFNISESTVRNYENSYKLGGIEGLSMGKSTGAPCKLTKEQEDQLYKCIETKMPKDVGYAPFVNWTANLARQWVESQFGVIYSERGMREVLYRLNFSYTRPTYTLKKADAEKQDQFRLDFEQVKDKLIWGEIDYILFEDESMIRDYQAISKSWFPKGKQRRIPTYGKHEGAKLIGVLDYESGSVYVEQHSKYDAEAFLEFLKNVLVQYPTGKIVLILDNARIHHAKLLQDFLEANKDRLTLMYLPPYSPNMNIIEGLWGWLKNSVINNVFFKSVNEIKEATQSFIQWVNSVPSLVIDRLCVQM
jgi:transposase